MAKDYFQDIVPPSRSSHSHARPHPGSHAHTPAHSAADPGIHIPIHTSPVADEQIESPENFTDTEEETMRAEARPGARSIRNISAPRPRPRGMSEVRDGREVQGVGQGVPRRPAPSRKWMWIAAGVSIVVLAIILFVALRPTIVTVIPRSHPVSFDESSQFTAYPATTAASGTLAYTVQTTDIEDSQVVASQGTVHSEDKASGSITVYNDYQTAPMKLVKTTRFETPDGLIFRVPADIVIPGKRGSTPGQVTVTVIADKAGEQYNVAASRFTLPGLKSSPSYAHVYAQSTDPMTGGFVGDKPGVAPGALESTVAEVRGRLEAKARASVAPDDSSVLFPELIQITYQDLADTPEAGGGVRIHERAHVMAPIFASADFASYVAQAISADAGDSSVQLVPGSGFAAHASDTTGVLGTDPIQFTLSGKAQLIWNVDSTALSQALAGRDQGAFQGIVSTFPSIQEAHARIEPFWKTSFPKDPGAIKIKIESVKA